MIKHTTSGIALMLFGVPFLAAGAIIMILGLSWWREYFDAKQWVQTPATIKEVHLREHRSSKGRLSYRVDCRYSYRFAAAALQQDGQAASERLYENTRVDFESGSSTDSQPHRRYEILKRHCESGEPFPAWVNPANPAQAVLFREAGEAMYLMPPFALVFALAGMGIMASGAMAVARSVRLRWAERFFPGRPWRAEGLWNDFSCHSRGKAKVIAVWAIAIFVAIFVSLLSLALASDEHAPGLAWVASGLFTAVAAGVLGYAVYLTLQYLKYGEARLIFTELPLVPGRPFAGLLLVPERVIAENGVQLTLRCTETRGSVKQRKVNRIFEEQKTVTEDLARPAE
ncbi:MAG: DUF3592 domain-containing protein, partial [Planctomycetota bacterium]|nr:DUF3592 domain-containing protein [Planctomycetota bacterium]